jgi:hypothetical protein
MAGFNLLGTWNGLEFDEEGILHLSIAEFGLRALVRLVNKL